MKRKICLVLMLTFIFVTVMQFNLLASDVSLYNNNTGRTNTSFTISADGTAVVRVGYEGYQNTTTGATIIITIEKRNFMLFWKDVVSETVVISGYIYSDVFNYKLDDTGTYRCTVKYVVSGTGGADDVITFEKEQKY